MRKLEDSGIISGYAALLNPERLGYALHAYISITFGKTKHRKLFVKAIQRIPEIVECHHVAGEEDFMLRVIARDTSHLEQLLGEQIRSLPGVLRTKTTVILSTQKSTSVVPLDQPTANPLADN